MATRSMHFRLPSALLSRFQRRGDDGLTDAERQEYLARWLAGQGARSTRAEMDRLQALALSKRAQRTG
jgi:hypothetical protein